MEHRLATPDDCRLLGELNHQLIQDEGHRNPMTPVKLGVRMRGWIQGEYIARLFMKDEAVIAYALYSQTPAGVFFVSFSSPVSCAVRG